VTGIIEWGQKPNSKNIPDQKLTPNKSHAKFLSLKKFPESFNNITQEVLVVLYTLFAKLQIYAGTATNLQIVLNTPKNPYLKQATPKLLAKFSYLKKSPN